MVVCSKCVQTLPSDGGFVSCMGCEGNYHFDCSIQYSTWNAKSEALKRNWRCETCRDKKKGNSYSQSKDKDLVGDTSPLTNDIAEIKRMLAGVKGQIDENTNGQSSLAESYRDIKRGQEEIQKQLALVEDKITKLISQNAERDKTIISLTERIAELEAVQCKDSLEIHGIGTSDKENVTEIAIKVAEKLDVHLERDEVVSAGRLEKKGSNAMGAIVVKLNNRKKINELLKKRKTRIMDGDVSDMKNGSEVRIYEHISPFLKKLLWNTKNRAKNVNWRFVWVQGGRILARKEEGSRILRISSEADISNLV